jgi:hypothetical protein
MNAPGIAATDTVTRIRELNDAFRTTSVGGIVMLTNGVDALCPEVKAEVLKRVREFDRFTPDNDPHGEHDFGSFDIGTQSFFWKIDCYDKNAEYGSEDHADPEKTTRVVTIMLAEEY